MSGSGRAALASLAETAPPLTEPPANWGRRLRILLLKDGEATMGRADRLFMTVGLIGLAAGAVAVWLFWLVATRPVVLAQVLDRAR